jgi:hypothetical protein
MVNQPGTYSISVGLDHADIKGSPFTVVIGATSDEVSVSGCTIPPPPLMPGQLSTGSGVVAGELGSLVAEARDSQRIPVTGLTAELDSVDSCSAAVISYIAPECWPEFMKADTNWTAESHTNWTANSTVVEQLLQRNASVHLGLYDMFVCSVRGHRNATQQNFTSMVALATACGATFTGYPHRDSQNFRFSATTIHDSTPLELPVFHVGLGRFKVAYWLYVAGFTELKVYLTRGPRSPVEINASPSVVTVHPAAPSAAHSVVTDASASFSTAAGETHTLVVRTADRFGNYIPEEHDPLRVASIGFTTEIGLDFNATNEVCRAQIAACQREEGCYSSLVATYFESVANATLSNANSNSSANASGVGADSLFSGLVASIVGSCPFPRAHGVDPGCGTAPAISGKIGCVPECAGLAFIGAVGGCTGCLADGGTRVTELNVGDLGPTAQLCTNETGPPCPNGDIAVCCDADGSCFDGDDDWCCDDHTNQHNTEFYCSFDGTQHAHEHAAAMGSALCPHRDAPACPAGGHATCCDEDLDCWDGDDEWCCDGFFYCTHDSVDYADFHKGLLCPVVDAARPPQTFMQVTSVGDGAFLITFSFLTVGWYSMDIHLGPDRIGSSPLPMVVVPSVLSNQYTSCNGPGIFDGVAGRPTQFTVTGRDAYGNELQAGGDAVHIYVRLDGITTSVVPPVLDEGDGKYTVSYTARSAERYRLDVFVISFLTLSRFIAFDSSDLMVAGLAFSFVEERPVAGLPATFAALVADPCGNPLPAARYAHRFGLQITRGSFVDNVEQLEPQISHDGSTIFFMQTVLEAGRFRVSMLFDGLEAGQEQFRTWLNGLPPAPTEARLMEDGSGLAVRFESGTDRAGKAEPFDCGWVFNVATVSSFGSDVGGAASCAWRDDTTLLAYFVAGNTISAYDEIVMRQRIKRADFESEAYRGTLTVLSPVNRQPMDLVLFHPALLGQCTDLTVDASTSLNPAPGAATFSYSVDPANRNADAINAYLTGKDGPTLTLARSMLADNHLYTLYVTMQNRFADNVVKAAQFDTTTSPLLSLQIPRQPDGTVNHRKGVVLSGEVGTPACSIPLLDELEVLVYKWTIETDVEAAAAAFDPVAHLIKTDARRLHIPPLALLDGTDYRFALTVSTRANATGSAVSTAAVELTTAPAELIAKVTGGSRTISKASHTVLTLDGSTSFDGHGTGLLYGWTCKAAEGGGSCFASLFQSIYTGVFSEHAMIEMPVAHLVTGALVFSLTIQSSAFAARKASTTTVVTCVPIVAPTIDVFSNIKSDGHVDKMSARDTVVVHSKVARLNGTHIWSAWPVVPFYSEYGVHGLDTAAMTVLPNTLAGGQLYRFQLSVHDATYGDGHAFVSILCNKPPSGGSVTLSPFLGDFMSTTFTMFFSGWKDEDLPLTHSVFVLDDSVFAQETRLSDEVVSSVVAFQIPVAGLLKLGADVTDSFGDATRNMKQANVRPAEYDAAAATAALALAKATQDLPALCRIIAALANGKDGRRRLEEAADPAAAALLAASIQVLAGQAALALFPEDSALLLQAIRDLMQLAPDEQQVAELLGIFTAKATRPGMQHGLSQDEAQLALITADGFHDSQLANMTALRLAVADVGLALVATSDPAAPAASVASTRLTVAADRIASDGRAPLIVPSVRVLGGSDRGSYGTVFVGWNASFFAVLGQQEHDALLSEVQSVYISGPTDGGAVYHALVPMLGGMGISARAVPAGHFSACEKLFVGGSKVRHAAGYIGRGRASLV